MTIYLRSSITGKVLTQEEWQHSLNEWDDEGGHLIRLMNLLRS